MFRSLFFPYDKLTFQILTQINSLQEKSTPRYIFNQIKKKHKYRLPVFSRIHQRMVKLECTGYISLVCDPHDKSMTTHWKLTEAGEVLLDDAVWA